MACKCDVQVGCVASGSEDASCCRGAVAGHVQHVQHMTQCWVGKCDSLRFHICLRSSRRHCHNATTAVFIKKQPAMRLAGEPAARFPHRFLLTVARTCVVDMVALVRRCRGAGVWPRSCPGACRRRRPLPLVQLMLGRCDGMFGWCLLASPDPWLM